MKSNNKKEKNDNWKNRNDNKKLEHQYLPIKRISEMLDIPQSALRYYEKKNLIFPIRDEESNYRKYTFLSLIELTNIIHYRNLGVPVKEIRTLMHSPISTALDAIDSIIDDTYKQLEKLQKTLRQLSLFERKARMYLSLSSGEKEAYTIVSMPEISRLYAFSFDNKVSMGEYLADPYSFPYGFFLEDPYNAEDYLDCIIETISSSSMGKHYGVYRENVVWDRDARKCNYLECLMHTEYGMTDKNNLQEHLEYMKAHDMKPGRVLGQYLVYDYSPEEKKRYDYYKIWIEIIE